MTLIEMTASI